MTPRETEVVACLRQHGELTAVQIMARTGMPEGTLKPILNRLRLSGDIDQVRLTANRVAWRIPAVPVVHEEESAGITAGRLHPILRRFIDRAEQRRA